MFKYQLTLIHYLSQSFQIANFIDSVPYEDHAFFISGKRLYTLAKR